MVAVVMVVLIGFGVLALDHEWSVMAGKAVGKRQDGKQGRTAEAMRTILGAVSGTLNRHFVSQIIE